MSDAPERRQDDELRLLVDEVYALVEPFFDTANTWNGQNMDLLAYRAIREHLPAIPLAEVALILPLIGRIYRSRHR